MYPTLCWIHPATTLSPIELHCSGTRSYDRNNRISIMEAVHPVHTPLGRPVASSLHPVSPRCMPYIYIHTHFYIARWVHHSPPTARRLSSDVCSLTWRASGDRRRQTPKKMRPLLLPGIRTRELDKRQNKCVLCCYRDSKSRTSVKWDTNIIRLITWQAQMAIQHRAEYSYGVARIPIHQFLARTMIQSHP